MSKNFWQGERVRLRAIEEDDADAEYYAIDENFDSESERYGDMIGFPTTPQRMADVIAEMSAKEPEGDEFFMIIENEDGEVIGNINSHSCSRRMGHFRYGIDIMERYRGMGYGTEAVLLLLRYFFCELRYHKCNVGIYSFNKPSIAFHESLGFVREGCLREMVYTNGKYYDELHYGMTADEYFASYGEDLLGE